MFSVLKSNLGRRIVFLVSLSMFLILTALVISGWLAIRQSSEQISEQRQYLAQATGNHLDFVLRQNLERLDSFQFARDINIEDDNLEPEKRVLHSTYLGSIFDDGTFITDREGTVLWIEPFRSDFVGTNIGHYPSIQQSLNSGKPSVSNILTTAPGDKKVIFMVTSLRNQEGRIVGLVGGQINPMGHILQASAQLFSLEQGSYIDIIDGNGVVVASSDSQRILKREEEIISHGQAEVTVSTQLAMSPWSVAVRQTENEALAPVRTMEYRFILFGLSSLVIALFLSWGMARSIVKPIGQLNTTAQNISQGDFSQPIPQLGSDEIGELGQSLDIMRIELKKSLDEIQQWNQTLEAKVEERTRQLEDSYREIERKEAARGELLRKVLTVQEEERRRIARELHDETTQSLAGLVMKLEAATATPVEANGKIKDMLLDIKNLALRTIDNVHKAIFDLRPSVLDDLGLLSALRWYAENRLGALGGKVRVEVTGEERKLPPEVEIALFRVVQEAINNIVRHAEAQNIVLGVEFKDSTIVIEVEDDGKGFDVPAVSLRADRVQGLGLLGMKERVALLGGNVDIESRPGRGTHLTIVVPLKLAER